MKNYIAIVTATLLVSSCNQAELDRSKHTNDSLQSIIDEQNFSLIERDSSLRDFVAYFNDVERNLDTIAMKQQIIGINSSKSPMEFKKNQKNRITEEIAAINNLLEENRKTITELNRKLKGSTNKNAQLKKMIFTLNNQLEQKTIELTALNEKLTELNLEITQLQTSMEKLTFDNAAQSANISEKTTKLHTAYYVMGKSKELETSKIIDKKGGLLGIGRTAKLNSDLDKNKFTQIDYTLVDKIAVNGQKVKLITSHPSDSYTLEKDTNDKDKVKNLMITNPEKFWSESKYLVLVKN